MQSAVGDTRRHSHRSTWNEH